jgi:hypothetical protein
MKYQKEYDDRLNENFPIEGFDCNPFSLLLKAGDPVAYNEGYNNFIDANNLYDEDEG